MTQITTGEEEQNEGITKEEYDYLISLKTKLDAYNKEWHKTIQLIETIKKQPNSTSSDTQQLDQLVAALFPGTIPLGKATIQERDQYTFNSGSTKRIVTRNDIYKQKKKISLLESQLGLPEKSNLTHLDKYISIKNIRMFGISYTSRSGSSAGFIYHTLIEYEIIPPRA